MKFYCLQQEAENQPISQSPGKQSVGQAGGGNTQLSFFQWGGHSYRIRVRTVGGRVAAVDERSAGRRFKSRPLDTGAHQPVFFFT